MKKILILLLGVSLFSACVKDTSAYVAQEKEDVQVDPESGETGEDPEIGPNDLRPGINLVTLDVEENGTIVKRRFKYYLPASVTSSKPVSLIFNFHGSYTYPEGSLAPDPLAGVNQNDALNQLAARENCITVFPAGEVLAEAVNWQNSEKHLPFVDAMLDYFSTKNPAYDIDRVYTCGHSSGAIFSFYLAFARSEVFAAAVPVSGQMALTGQTVFPQTVVPIRAFNGTTDDAVIYTAALNNITIWAEKIAGYYPINAVKLDTLTIEGYKDMARMVWHGGPGDIEFFSVLDEGHGVNWSRIMSFMWEFMSSHVRNQGEPVLFVNASVNEIALFEGETTTFNYSCTSGAAIEFVDAPAGWQIVRDNNTIQITAPAFSDNVAIKGAFDIKATLDGRSASTTVWYELKTPVLHFTVGDVYYNASNEPVGVVVWVNPRNVREAKIICLEWPENNNYANTTYGALGMAFDTPDRNDGEGNTAKIAAYNATLDTPLTPLGSGMIWAATYSYKGVSGWYLPAVDELAAIYPFKTVIAAKLNEIGARPLANVDYYSSTTQLNGSGGKLIYYCNFNTGATATSTNTAESPGYVYVRAFKKVTW